MCKKCGYILDTMYLKTRFLGHIGRFESMEYHNIMGKPVDIDGNIREDKKKCEFFESENLL